MAENANVEVDMPSTCRPFHPSPYHTVKIILVNVVRADEWEGLDGQWNRWAGRLRKTRESEQTSDSGRTTGWGKREG